MRKITLLLMTALLCAGSVKAATLWTGTATTGDWGSGDDACVKVSKDKFTGVKAGDVIKLTISNYDTSATYWQYSLKQLDNSWYALPSFKNGNLTQGAESASYCLTSEDATALSSYGLVIQGYYITITKVELLTISSTETISSTSTALSETSGSEKRLALTWDDKGKFSEANMYDFICVTYQCTAATGTYNSYLQLANPSGWDSYSTAARQSLNAEEGETKTTLTFTYSIPNATVLEAIQQSGVLIRGVDVTVTKVELLKSSERYDAVAVTIGTDGIATFSTSSKSLDFNGTGITPYYASEVASATVTLTSVRYTRGYQGYVLKGAAGTYDLKVVDTTEDYPSTNYLKPTGDYRRKVYKSAYSDYSGDDSDVENIKTKYRYLFAKNSSNETGFYLLSTSYTDSESNPYYTLAAHKAFLETDSDISSSSARVAIVFDEEGGTTGVSTVNREAITNNQYYNLAGQRVDNPAKGLYIVNGKKVVIK